MRDLAVRLMAWEAKASRSSGTRPKEVFLVCEKLRPHLAGLTTGIPTRTSLHTQKLRQDRIP